MLNARLDTASCLFATVSIGLISCVGDNLLYRLKSNTLRAISDNLTHALVGGLSWSLIVILSKKSIQKNVLGITLCFLIASLIDLDHFLQARSWKLRDAAHLGRQRPILHCSAIPLFIWLGFEISHKVFHHTTLGYYVWVIITGFLSHHVRDATRRGMWFGFLGSTPAIPYYLYVVIAMVLPYCMYWIIPDKMINDGHHVSLIQSV